MQGKMHLFEPNTWHEDQSYILFLGQFNVFWSLQLAYSAQQAATIKKLGLKNFLKQTSDSPFDANLSDFLENSPQTIS